MNRFAKIAASVAIAWSLPVDANAPQVPELFAPGVISTPANDGSPTFTPDGNTLLFTRSTATWSAILESHRVNGTWTQPALASFSGEWPDSSPGIAPDGSYAVFVSIRPKDGGDAHAAREAQLYRVDRTTAGWGKPVRLPPTVNIGPSIWKPSVGGDGTIYFVSIDTAGHKRLYSAARVAAGYAPAQPLSFSDGTLFDVDPEIAPDGSFLIFCSSGRLKGDPKDHLFIVHKTPSGAWGDVRPIRYAGDDANGFSTDDEPHLGPDHRTIYFSSDRAAPVSFPRAHDQAVRDVERLEQWDNSNSNVWTLKDVT
jgi:Tol biopolymer transport system component